MTLFSKLRESRNLDLDQLSQKIKLSIDRLEAIEKEESEPTTQELRSLAHYYGCASEDLAQHSDKKKETIPTTEYYILTDETIEDGWWGHIGLSLCSKYRAKWYPITLNCANRLTYSMQNILSPDDWVVASTLNNRLLAFRPCAVAKTWLLDEAQVAPTEEWEVPIDGYLGRSPEFYKALEEYYFEELSSDTPWAAREEIEAFTEECDLNYEQIGQFLFETQVFGPNGEEETLGITGSNLVDIVSDIETTRHPLLLRLRTEEFDIFRPSASISLVDMPHRQFHEALTVAGQ